MSLLSPAGASSSGPGAGGSDVEEAEDPGGMPQLLDASPEGALRLTWVLRLLFCSLALTVLAVALAAVKVGAARLFRRKAGRRRWEPNCTAADAAAGLEERAGRCLPKCFYINLDRRCDRRRQIEAQLEQARGVVGCQRFRAVQARSGLLPNVASCRSHVGALERLQSSGAAYGMVLEDDVVWATADMDAVEHHICRLGLYLQDYPVVLLACNPGEDSSGLGNYTRFDGLITVSACQTASAYVVRLDYMQTLIDLWRAMPETKDSWTDQAWKVLQKRDVWAMTWPVLLKQAPSWSDMGGVFTDYGGVRL